MRALLALLIVTFLSTTNLIAQKVLSFETPIVSVDNKTYTLLEVDDYGLATIKYEEYREGKLWKSGTYYNNKVDKTWNEYDLEGNIIASIEYKYGKKITYTTIKDNKKQTVHYINNKPSLLTTEVSLALN